MAPITKPMALDESFNTTETNPRSIADVLVGIEGALSQGMGRQANEVAYDNTTSGLSADDVQEAVDELAAEKVDKVTGKGLSTNDYTTAEKEKLAGIEAGAQVNPTIDSALSDSSTNAVQNKVVKGALDGKADNADVAGTQTVSGNPLTLTDAAPINAESLVVELDPKQDLHGQSAPYVGGAGKNKLPMTVEGIKAGNTSGTWTGNVYNRNGVDFTILTDSDGNVTGIKVNGTASANSAIDLGSINGLGTCVLNGCPATGSESTYYLGTQRGVRDFGSGASVPSNENHIAYIFVESGYNAQNLLFYPMIRLSTETDPTFAPYSNICPITGYDECEVDDVGKNLVEEILDECFINSNGAIISGQSDFSMCIAKTIKGMTYVITTNDPNGFVGNFFYDKPVVGSVSYDGTRIVANNKIFTAPIDGYVAFRTSIDYATPQCEIGSQPTTYEPYNSSNATIQFGQTVYGGKVDFLTGVVTVDKWFDTFDGSSDEQWAEYPSYNGFNIEVSDMVVGSYMDGISNRFATLQNHGFGIRFGASNNRIYVEGITTNISGVSDLASWKTWLSNNPLQVCYPLATHQTIQLTPQELQLLKGTNNITTNGTTINLDYIPNNSIGDAVKASEEYTDRAVKKGIEKHLEMPYLRILDNNVDTPINNYRIYFHMIASAYTLVNMAEMLQHRFIFVEVIRNPSGTSSDELLHSVLIDPRTIDGFAYSMKVGGSDTIVIDTKLANNKFSMYLQTTGSYDDGDPTDYYVTIRMVD